MLRNYVRKWRRILRRPSASCWAKWRPFLANRQFRREPNKPKGRKMKLRQPRRLVVLADVAAEKAVGFRRRSDWTERVYGTSRSFPLLCTKVSTIDLKFIWNLFESYRFPAANCATGQMQIPELDCWTIAAHKLPAILRTDLLSYSIFFRDNCNRKVEFQF